MAAGLNQNETEPVPDEVARKACFNYVNQGSLPGHDVRHWLEAEAQLVAERQLSPSPKPQKRASHVSKSRDIRTEAASSSEDQDADRMKTARDSKKLFRICALL